MQAETKYGGAPQAVMREDANWLRLANKHLTALIEAVPDAIFIKDDEGGWWATNEQARNMFSLDAIIWQGKTEQELAVENPDLCLIFQKLFGDDPAGYGNSDQFVFERSIIDETGQLQGYEVRKAPIFSEDGQHEGLLVIARNITDRKRDEIKLRIAETAIEAQEGIIITDSSNNILRVNTAFTKLTGYSHEEVIGKKTTILKSGRHDKAFYQDMWETLRSERFWQGEIWDRRKNGEIYLKWLTITAVEGPEGQIDHYVGAFTDISQNKEAEEALHRLAFYDALTDLPNRRLLCDRLERAQTASTRSHMYDAVLLIDLDDFKSINDSKGHRVGDLLLTEIAQRLKSCVRKEDTVARFGGDEFVILLESLSEDRNQAATYAGRLGEKILEAISQPCLLEGVEFYSSSSIGICIFIDRDIAAEEILKCADTAMYQAKNSGRNCLRFYDPYMQAVQEARINIASDLRCALSENQLKVYYQPQVTSGRQVFGAEALARWNHPQRGPISPAQFIPIAEETGLILSIGEWVLRTSCNQLKAWENSSSTRDWSLSVNVSARQFRQPDFTERVRKVLEQTGANPMRLKLELTESVVLHNIADTITKMQDLRSLGIGFAMDDFGTGYSSLSALKKLPIDQLKIDRSFVRDIPTSSSDSVIVQTIIGMANSLGLNVVAEGVETEEQFACLEKIGCTAYQGYLFGKPMPVHEFEGAQG